MPNIGDKVKNRVSGFEGVITGRAEYLNGCRQYLISPPVDEKDGYRDAVWCDEQTLDVTETGLFVDPFSATSAPATAGGPDRRSI